MKTTEKRKRLAISALCCLAIAIMLVFTGCGKNNKSPELPKEELDKYSERFTFSDRFLLGKVAATKENDNGKTDV